MCFVSICFEANDHTDVMKMWTVKTEFALCLQMLVEQEAAAQSQSVMESPGGGLQLQLQQALQQISQISTTLCDIQLCYQGQVCETKQSIHHSGYSFLHAYISDQVNVSEVDGSSVPSELQSLRELLEKTEEEKKALEAQLSEANSAITELQQQGNSGENVRQNRLMASAENRSKAASWMIKCGYKMLL